MYNKTTYLCQIQVGWRRDSRPALHKGEADLPALPTIYSLIYHKVEADPAGLPALPTTYSLNHYILHCPSSTPPSILSTAWSSTPPSILLYLLHCSILNTTLYFTYPTASYSTPHSILPISPLLHPLLHPLFYLILCSIIYSTLYSTSSTAPSSTPPSILPSTICYTYSTAPPSVIPSPLLHHLFYLLHCSTLTSSAMMAWSFSSRSCFWLPVTRIPSDTWSSTRRENYDQVCSLLLVSLV